MKLIPSICLITALLIPVVTIPTLRAGEPAVNPTGIWKLTAPTNPDGKIPNITFNLKLQGETLTGTVNKSAGPATITNGVVKGDEISFQTIREGNGGKTTTTYNGKLNGDTIKGKITIDVDKTKFHNDSEWEARRVKE